MSTNTVHVVPQGDLVEHDTSTDQDDCVCVPAVQRVPNEHGPDGWVLVHHALDGRETADPSPPLPEEVQP